MKAAAGKQEVTHLLSFDVEAYFQVEAASTCVPRDTWDDRDLRLAGPLDVILQLLDAHDVRATFFFLGCVARREPDLVQRAADAGHEIATHGDDHRMLGALSSEAFRRDLLSSRARLEDLAGRPVLGYRAPTFSVTPRTTWALDVLAEEGFRYDSSVYPVPHDRYGMPGAPRFAHLAVTPRGATLLEVPPLSVRLAGVNLPIGGGGYLRLLPAVAVSSALRAAKRRARPGMIYLHPWEFDPAQPVLAMSRLGRWRHRVGLGRTATKLAHLLRRHRFGCVRDQLDALVASTDETFSYPAPAGA
jgi:polysaccharide deacetylase family protein (PEP-CTERM system associated)